MAVAPFEHMLRTLALLALTAMVGGSVTARILRLAALRWTWALLGFPVGVILEQRHPQLLAAVWGVSLIACVLGRGWHRIDLERGADFARAARNMLGPLGAVKGWWGRWRVRRHGWISGGRLVVGFDGNRTPVAVPVGYSSGSHTLIVGATGSGKTVSEAWIACRLVEHGHAAVAIDPKGDDYLAEQLRLAAARAGRRMWEWSPSGPLAYNPYAHGSASEIADKALAGETFTEPHYLRQAQRYLGHAVRAMHAADLLVTPGSLMRALDPAELELTARALPEQQAEPLLAYLDSLSERQRRDLAGVRDRLSILAESDTRKQLEPADPARAIDLRATVADGDVVLFRLDADRRPLLAEMLASAIVSDLVTLVGELQANPLPTVVLVDEFSALAARQVARLFARGRSAGISLILATQELADLKTAADGLRDQVLGNVQTLIAHRQNVPESAELIAHIAGTHAAWVTTEQTNDGLIHPSGATGRGSRRRGYEFNIHPTQIKQLATGQAVVITPGSGRPPAIAAICRPGGAHGASSS